MPNKRYVKGRAKEYKISKELRDIGWDIVQRTAGSHSPIDVFAINRATKEIAFIQAKPESFNSDKIEETMAWLNGDFKVKFWVE